MSLLKKVIGDNFFCLGLFIGFLFGDISLYLTPHPMFSGWMFAADLVAVVLWCVVVYLSHRESLQT